MTYHLVSFELPEDGPKRGKRLRELKRGIGLFVEGTPVLSKGIKYLPPTIIAGRLIEDEERFDPNRTYILFRDQDSQKEPYGSKLIYPEVIDCMKWFPGCRREMLPHTSVNLEGKVITIYR